MPLVQDSRAQIKLQGNERDGRAGRPDYPGGWGSFAIKNQGILIISNKGVYVPPLPVVGAQLNNFSVTTSSGTINVNWGDGTSDTLTSTVLVNHTFFCPGASGPAGFWNNIQPCL